MYDDTLATGRPVLDEPQSIYERVE